MAHNIYNLNADKPRMGFLDDDVSNYSVMTYQNKMGFDMKDDNFVFADIHIMRNLRLFKHIPKSLTQLIWFGHRNKNCILAFEPDGMLFIGLNKVTDFVDDFQNPQYYFSGHNYFLPLEDIREIRFRNGRLSTTMSFETNLQLMHFIVPSFLPSREFQYKNYCHLQQILARWAN